MSRHDRHDSANAYMGGGRAGRFQVRHRWTGAGLQAETESRSVLRSTIRILEETIDVGKNTADKRYKQGATMHRVWIRINTPVAKKKTTATSRRPIRVARPRCRRVYEKKR